MGRATASFSFAPPPLWGPGEGSKGHISFNFNYNVNFNDFHSKQIVCVLTNERYKTYQTGFSFCRLGHARERKLWGAGGAKGVRKNLFFKHGHVAYQINGDNEQSRMQVKFLS